VAVYCDGVQIHSKPLQPNFENDRFIRSYFGLYSHISQYCRDSGNGISPINTKMDVHYWLSTSQLDSSYASFELIKHGNICLELHFAAAIPHTLTVIVFSEHDNLLEIDRDRNVAFNYTA